MKIIDTHAHIFPSKIADKAVGSISHFYGDIEMRHSGSAEELLSSGSRVGVEKYLVFSTATTPSQVVGINDFILSQAHEHKEFIGLGTMHIDFENPAAELERLKRSGINGIKLHPDFQRFNIDDKRMDEVYGTLSELNMLLLTHSGDYRYGYSHPERVARVAEKFPKMNIIAAHFGGWSQWHEARRCLLLDNVYVDTSSTFGFAKDNTEAKKGFERFDNTHIFFGTDFPMWDHEGELKSLMSLGLSDKLLEDVLYNNFVNFYSQYN